MLQVNAVEKRRNSAEPVGSEDEIEDEADEGEEEDEEDEVEFEAKLFEKAYENTTSHDLILFYAN